MSTSPPLSPISRRFRRYLMQRCSSAAVALALKNAPPILSLAKQRRIQTLARRMAACAASAYIKLQTPPADATRIVYFNKRSCKSGICPPCSRARAIHAKIRMSERLDYVISQVPQSRFIFITLTMKNVPIADTAKALSDFEQAFTRWWRTKEITRAFTGHVTGIEVAVRRSHGYWESGVHCHCLVSVNGPHYFDRKRDLYLSQRQIVALWRRSLRIEYKPVCHVTAIPSGDAARASLREVLKYSISSKSFLGGGHVDPTVALYLADALYKRRMTRFGGLFATTKRYRAAKAMQRNPAKAGSSPANPKETHHEN